MLRWSVHLKGGPKRYFHAALAVGHKLYSFGGHSYDMGQIEVHIFNTVSMRWAKLPPVKTRTGDVPCLRWGHTAVLIQDTIYIWGGVDCTGEYIGALHAFAVDTHKWFKPQISGPVPRARCGHSACALGKVMYIFGGFNGLTEGNNEMTTGGTDIYTFNTITMVWSLIKARGSPSPASSCHSATIIKTKMFVFGGQGDHIKDYYHNIRVFDTQTNSWLRTPSALHFPEGREGHSAFTYNGELYVFGGQNFFLYKTFDDLWKFNPETFSWKLVKPRGRGLSYWMCRMCCCMVGDRIILFGGYRYTPIPGDVEDLDDGEEDTKVSDLYILDLNPSLKTLCKLAVIQCGLERLGLPHDIRWELEVMTATEIHKPDTWLPRVSRTPCGQLMA